MVDGKSIIQQLYDGDINVYEHSAPTSPGHIAALGKIAAEKKYLMSILSDNDGERLEAFQNYMDEAAEFDKQIVFTYAFKLAGRLMVEVIGGDLGTVVKTN